MATCQIDGCDETAQLTAHKEGRSLKVCTKCGPEMKAVMGWEIVAWSPGDYRTWRTPLRIVT